MHKGHEIVQLPPLPTGGAPPNLVTSLPVKKSRLISLEDVGKEPFRIFFPAGVLAGIVGVSLWPLYFWGVTQFYPGQTHPRVMTYGFFAGFIFGFLGTALPRMLSASPFRPVEVIPLVTLHLATVFSLAAGKVFLGDALFLALLAGFFGCVAVRASKRQDTPPPGFVLIGLAFLCVASGAIISMVENYGELDIFWVTLQRLLSYQGFVLLPILGVGPFLLPRFFGMPNRHDFPEGLVPTKRWAGKALLALGTGSVIIASFLIEARGGWPRAAHALRFAATLGYLFLEMPFHRAPKAVSAMGASIRIAFIGVLSGFLTAALFPGYRVSLLHLTLVGGFAVVAFVVATRVVFGHSGNMALLKGRNRWLLIAIGLMLFGMATRMSGDFWPKLLVSHYIYGAILWIAGAVLWSAYVLPKVLTADDET
jgi:uncharacterized protein involved in response to NO